VGENTDSVLWASYGLKSERKAIGTNETVKKRKGRKKC
jgi:hypothetical protein